MMIDLSAAARSTIPEAERLRYRKACQDSLFFLCKGVLGFKDFTPSLHKEVCSVVSDETYRRTKIQLPRASFKSHIATIGYPIWRVIQDPDPSLGLYGCNERIMIANAVAKNSQHFLAVIKSTFEKNEIFRWLFPELIPDFRSPSLRWNQDEATIKRDREFPEPTFSAVGVGTSVVSRHFTCILLDDLINEEHAASPASMQKAIDWYGLCEPLLEKPENKIVVIGTRWAITDLYSHIEKVEGEYEPTANPKGYRSYIRSAIEDGKAIFPERLPMAELARLRRNLGPYRFSCLYLNSPSNPDVLTFEERWLNLYELSQKNWICLRRKAGGPPVDETPIDPTPMQRAIMIDIAASQSKRSDSTAIVAMACDSKNRIFILEAFKGKVRSSEFIKRAVRYARKWHAEAIYFENYGQQKLVQDPLENAIAEGGRYIPVRPIRAAGTAGAVEAQVEYFGRYCQNGQVFYRESMTEFLEEYLGYPLLHPDLLAAISYAPKIFRFDYSEVPEDIAPIDEEVAVDERNIRVRHARPAIVQDPNPIAELIAREAEEDFDSMLFLNGRSTVTGY